MQISIIVPVYNEDKTIKKILKKINTLKIWNDSNFQKEIIVVDDKSTDETSKILKENSDLFSKLITNERNCGKGFSVKKAVENVNVEISTYSIGEDMFGHAEFYYISIIDLLISDKNTNFTGSDFIVDGGQSI